MTQSPESALIRYRIDEARDTLDDIQLLLTHGRLRAAANRIYYAAFYAAQAALLTKKLQFSKHSAVITFFDKEFVKTPIAHQNQGSKPAKPRGYIHNKLSNINLLWLRRNGSNLNEN